MPFDAQDFLLGEARQSRDLLQREIHYLAYHYHWSEREILGLSVARREFYLGMVRA